MAIPDDAILWEYLADPSDILAYVARFDIETPDGKPPVLDVGETIVSMTAEIEDSSGALGGTILEGDFEDEDRGPWIADDGMCLVWVMIAEEMRSDPAFSTDAGAAIGVVFTIKTSLFNTYQFTFYFRAKHK